MHLVWGHLANMRLVQVLVVVAFISAQPLISLLAVTVATVVVVVVAVALVVVADQQAATVVSWAVAVVLGNPVLVATPTHSAAMAAMVAAAAVLAVLPVAMVESAALQSFSSTHKEPP